MESFYGLEIMTAIKTLFKGPTNTKGPRMVAKCELGSHTSPYDHALSIGANHLQAAESLKIKFGLSFATAAGEYQGSFYHVKLV